MRDYSNMNFLMYFGINLLIFLVALFVNFRIRERGSINMLDQFDEYRKKQYNPADYVKNMYNENDFRPDPNRGRHTPDSHTYVDIFANQTNRAATQAKQTAGRIAKQVAQGNPALEKAFRELQQEFQKNRQK